MSKSSRRGRLPSKFHPFRTSSARHCRQKSAACCLKFGQSEIWALTEDIFLAKGIEANLFIAPFFNLDYELLEGVLLLQLPLFFWSEI